MKVGRCSIPSNIFNMCCIYLETEKNEDTRSLRKGKLRERTHLWPCDHVTGVIHPVLEISICKVAYITDITSRRITKIRHSVTIHYSWRARTEPEYSGGDSRRSNWYWTRIWRWLQNRAWPPLDKGEWTNGWCVKTLKTKRFKVVFKWLLRSLRLVIASKILPQFFNQWDAKPKRIAVTCNYYSGCLLLPVL